MICRNRSPDRLQAELFGPRSPPQAKHIRVRAAASPPRAQPARFPKENEMKKIVLTAMFFLAGMALPCLASAQTSSRQDRADQQIQTLVSAQMQKKDVFCSV